MFTVPLVPNDLRHEESIIQAAYALDLLQKTINSIFVRIDKRIEKNNEKVEELKERIKKSQTKIKQLQGTRKAIHIYAPSKFPAAHIFKDIPKTFVHGLLPAETMSGGKELDDQEKQAKYEIKKFKLDNNLPPNSDKLVFFHVRDKTEVSPLSSLAAERLKIRQNNDLGCMPTDLRSIPSLLLFNSDMQIYDVSDSTERTDSWKSSKFLRNKRQSLQLLNATTPKRLLEPAPHSLAHRNVKITPSGGLKYTPKLSEAPDLDLPLDLPDLPGIADDLRYESNEAKLEKIAPSLALVVENLPEVQDLLKQTKSAEQNENIPSEFKTEVLKPPPPPPMPTEKVSVAVPVPPPPPPPAAATTTKTKPQSSSSDSRSELMSEIRMAGGLRKLKPAAPIADDSQVHSKKSNSKETAAPRGDLMADLHNKLLMRRKGISGAKDNVNDHPSTSNSTTKTISGNPVISRLSALIPPPPPSAAAGGNDEDDSNDTDWMD